MIMRKRGLIYGLLLSILIWWILWNIGSIINWR